MANEERIIEQLKSQYPQIAETIRLQRDRRLWIDVPYAEFRAFLEYVYQNMSFVTLTAITGLDDGENLSALYHLGRRDGTLMNVKTSVKKASPKISSIKDIFPAAVLYERELVDLLGFEVEGLPDGNRYPLVDDWPEGQYPLRKDWKLEMLNVQEQQCPPEETKEGK